ncbi:VHS domain-containing protein [Salix suchowensis]|nr:VHS domain-containing protein [Salix suchowensis]
MQHKGTTNNINGAPPDSASHFTSQPATFPSNQSTNGPTALSPGPSSTTPTKQPYGSGDADDGYTLVFPNIDAFHAWRVQEEETQMVEGHPRQQGDPPRFREHTKLVCARHSRSGRKKYVKKHPDRVRKVPSRKVSGDPAQVRTYELIPESSLRDKDVQLLSGKADLHRAGAAEIDRITVTRHISIRTSCALAVSIVFRRRGREMLSHLPDMSQHSHEVGLANLPFTRRGRKAATTEEKERSRKHFRPQDDASNTLSPTPAPDPQNAPAPLPPPPVQNHAPVHNHNAIAGPSNIQQPAATYPAAISALAPLPSQSSYQPQQRLTSSPPISRTLTYSRRLQCHSARSLGQHVHTFQSVREHARNFAYPAVSVAALETILIRLYLESPVGSIAVHINRSRVCMAASSQQRRLETPP